MAADPNWTPAETLSFAPLGSQQMALAVTGAPGGDTVHLVWVAAKTLYHARRVGGIWQAAVKVAGGEQPALAVGPDGALYCASANWFVGNRDIYVSTWKNEKWSLPVLVSRTTGESSDPAICVTSDGLVHLVWADNTPGFSIIYYGVRDAQGWTYAPIPSGRGSRPSISASPNAIYVTWQDRLSTSTRDAFEVFVAAKRGGEWELPADVSDTEETHSLVPRIAANSSDRCHVAWQEERDELYVVQHADLWPNGWEAPAEISDPSADARLGAVLSNKLGHFQFVWSEGGLLKHRVRPGEPNGAWWDSEIACEDCTGLSELAAAISANGELHVVYNRWIGGGERQLFYLRRKALERNKVLLPMVGAS